MFNIEAHYGSHRDRMSKHAKARQQQRSVRDILIDLLEDYAEPSPAGAGAEILHFSKATWGQVEADLGHDARNLERYRHVYLVRSRDGQIITVGWRH